MDSATVSSIVLRTRGLSSVPTSENEYHSFLHKVLYYGSIFFIPVTLPVPHLWQYLILLSSHPCIHHLSHSQNSCRLPNAIRSNADGKPLHGGLMQPSRSACFSMLLSLTLEASYSHRYHEPIKVSVLLPLHRHKLPSTSVILPLHTTTASTFTEVLNPRPLETSRHRPMSSN